MVLSKLYKQIRWGKKAANGALSALYSGDFPSRNLAFNEVPWLVVDCEMTGLNVHQDTLLSIGWVQINGAMIDYSSGQHVLCHSEDDVGDSVKIHGLSDRNVAGAGSVSRALNHFAKAIAGRVLVFHHAYLDLAFLNRAAKASYGCPLFFPYVDTMMIEKRRLDKQGKAGGLQLELCRDRHELPPAFAHNALSDAIATAELFLAQCSHMGSKNLKLEDLKSEWA